MQVQLFNREPFSVPQCVQDALNAGAALSINISGGKDSQALLKTLLEHRKPEWTGDIFAHHADLGRAEWFDTPETVRQQAVEAGLPLVISKREKGDLFQRFDEREEKLRGTGKVHWASPSQRYCTSDLKRGPILKFLRQYNLVVIAVGIRAQESANRSRMPSLAIEKIITGKAYRDMAPDEAVAAWLENPSRGRLALRWNAIHHFTEDDVWDAIGTSRAELEARRELYATDEAAALDGWPAHNAYVRGNSRLSCALCIMGRRSDLVNGARHNPDAAWHLLGGEIRTGYTFRQDLSIEDVMLEAGLLLPVLSNAPKLEACHA